MLSSSIPIRAKAAVFEDHAVAAVLGLDAFDEDDLYAALDWLQANQERIERALAPNAG